MSQSFSPLRKVWLTVAAAPLLMMMGCQSSGTKPATAAPQGAVVNASSAASPGSTTSSAPRALDYPSDSEWIYKLATLEDVQASISATAPPQASVTVRGLLPDGATRINDIKVQKLPEGVFLTITTARPRQAIATMALVPFERTVTVDLQGLPKGECRITANELSTTVVVP